MTSCKPLERILVVLADLRLEQLPRQEDPHERDSAPRPAVEVLGRRRARTSRPSSASRRRAGSTFTPTGNSALRRGALPGGAARSTARRAWRAREPASTLGRSSAQLRALGALRCDDRAIRVRVGMRLRPPLGVVVVELPEQALPTRVVIGRAADLPHRLGMAALGEQHRREPEARTHAGRIERDRGAVRLGRLPVALQAQKRLGVAARAAWGGRGRPWPARRTRARRCG